MQTGLLQGRCLRHLDAARVSDKGLLSFEPDLPSRKPPGAYARGGIQLVGRF